jgi:hypothetical protein
MKKKPGTKNQPKKLRHLPKRAVVRAHKHVKPHAIRAHGWYKSKNIFQKILIWFFVLLTLVVGTSYGIARWYIWHNQDKPLRAGVTFVAPYARHLDLDPQQTMQALIDEMGVRQFRLVSYWNIHEPEKDKYDFSELDWQFRYAEAANAKVSLAIGLRQPRWPECHMPTWAMDMEMREWLPHLKEYMRVVIERYKDSPALESYQLENEFFMKVFGDCPDHTRERLVEEYEFVKQLDPSKPVIISRSNNAAGLPLYAPRPDLFAVSIYKRVWDKTITKRYFEYPFPAWFYGLLAGAGELVTGRDMIIHELQAEPWAPTGTKEASLEEQDKSLNPTRLRDRFRYGEATGMREMYLWGAEWWYWRKVKHNDSGVWDVAKEEFNRINRENANCSQAPISSSPLPQCR